MDQVLTEETTMEETIQIQKEIQQYLLEVKQVREQMQRTQSEIEQSQSQNPNQTG